MTGRQSERTKPKSSIAIQPAANEMSFVVVFTFHPVTSFPHCHAAASWCLR